MPRVTAAELAKALKRHKTAIQAALETKRIVRGDDGLFDLDEAVRAFEENTQHSKGYGGRPKTGAPAREPELPEPSDAESMDYRTARAVTQIYEARTKKLKYEERAGNLVPKKDVENARFAEFRILREACANIPSRVAAQLASENQIAKCQQLLDAEIASVFNAFSAGKLS
jgi:hypothetical protein